MSRPSKSFANTPNWWVLCRFLLVFLTALNLTMASAWAQDDQPPVAPRIDAPAIDQVTEAKIKEFQSKIASAADLDEQTRATIDTIINQTLEELQRAAQMESSAKADRDLVQNVQSRVRALKNELDSSAEASMQEFPENATLSQLESELAKRLVHFQDLKSQTTQLRSELSRRADRRKQIAILQASHAARVTEAERQLAVNAPSGESSWMTTARNLLQLTKLQSLALEMPAYQWELAKYDAEKAVELVDLQVESAKRKTNRIETEIEQLNIRIDEIRKKQAHTRIEQLRDFVESIRDPRRKAPALRNAELAEQNQEVVEKIGQTTSQIEDSRERLELLRQRFARTRSRVERAGLSGAIGLELRNQLSRLPEVREIRRQGLSRQATMRDVELKRLTHEDELLDLDRGKLPEDADELTKQIHADYVDTLGSLSKNYDTYFQQLSELDFIESQLIEATGSYRSFLDEHVLWIRSDGIFNWQSLVQAVATLRDFLAPAIWSEVLGVIPSDWKTHPWIYVLALLTLLLLLPARYRGRGQLVALGKTAERATCTEFSVTLRAALMTVIMAIVWPAVLIFFGWRLITLPLGPSLAAAIGRGLIATGVVLSLLNVVRQSCRPMGLALAHFGWSDRVADLLRRQVRQLRYVILPLTLIIVTMQEQDTLSANNSLLRLCFSAGLLVLASALFRILHPRRGVFVEYFQKNSNTWVTKSKNLWIWIAVGFPVAMAILTLAGFSYTSDELTWRFWHTLWITVSLVAVRAFAIRALQINQRRLRIEKARERRAAIETGEELAAANQGLASESDDYDVLGVNREQALRILHSGLLVAGILSMWFLWSGIFPAFRILDQWTLWETTREVSIEVPLEEGGFQLKNETVVDAITPINILAAVFIAFVTFTLVRNVPGLIEITILQRLPMDPSFKFAIAMMCRYVILVVGLLMMFSAIGASWSKFQWLVAALTVGLGFGLQEIFGNFVSGLIILWERPIRIGDVVTLDGVSGTVSRIQTRATTISDWDRKEYIVPNKDFVTGRLLNWTRSDQVSRIVIPVGIAYGSDVRLALDLLKQVAQDHPRIVDDPPIISSFESFGDSSLNLVLRCFMPNLKQRLETISELHLAIDDTFREAGIEIAFPQQDLHVRSLPDDLQQRLGL